MNYEYAFPHIPVEDVKLIFELGARDCKDSITLQQRFGCPVYTFECNPDGLVQCHETLKSAPGLPIHLIQKAVNSYNGETSFFPFDPTKDSNIGASSLFHHKFDSHVQKEVVVSCCRLDTFISETTRKGPDLLCMDIQGAELIALQSLGPFLRDVNYVASECSIEGYYADSYTFKDMYMFMTEQGFEIIQSGYSHYDLIEYVKGNTMNRKEMDVVWVRQ